jgi:hypothetical protein
MDLIDFLLNLAGLLLWLNWLSVRFDPLARPLRPHSPALSESRHPRPAMAAGLLSEDCCWGALSYTGTSNGGELVPQPAIGRHHAVVPCDFYSFDRVLLFSGLSFVVMLVAFYRGLLLLSFLRERTRG